MDDDSNPSGAPLGPHTLFEDFPEVLRRARLGVCEALGDHQAAGNSIAIWREGAVTMIAAEAIRLPQRERGFLKSFRKGERVRVSRRGGWRESFLATIVYGPKEKRVLGTGVDWYYGVRFDAPQDDLSDDGPYAMAEILSQYLQAVEDE